MDTTKFEILAILMATFWPNLANFGPYFEKKINWFYFALVSVIFEVWHILTQIWPFGYLAEWASLQISGRCFKMCKILKIQ